MAPAYLSAKPNDFCLRREYFVQECQPQAKTDTGGRILKRIHNIYQTIWMIDTAGLSMQVRVRDIFFLVIAWPGRETLVILYFTQS